jgi:hypothetical protein
MRRDRRDEGSPSHCGARRILQGPVDEALGSRGACSISSRGHEYSMRGAVSHSPDVHR